MPDPQPIAFDRRGFTLLADSRVSPAIQIDDGISGNAVRLLWENLPCPNPNVSIDVARL
jgi:hypothetical protein